MNRLHNRIKQLERHSPQVSIQQVEPEAVYRHALELAKTPNDTPANLEWLKEQADNFSGANNVYRRILERCTNEQPTQPINPA